MQLNFKESRLISFTKYLYKSAKRSIAAYSSKFSRHDYTQPQHLSLNGLKRRLRLNYREVVEIVDEMPRVKKILGLKKIPHFTTIQKFFQRISTFLLERILNQTLKLFEICEPWVAIDGTGHSSSYASRYYAKKLKKQKKRRRKSYSKNSIAVDIKTQAILAHKVRKGPKHDSIDAIPIIRKTKRYKPRGYSLDKGYDAEHIHKVIREEIKAESHIPLREGKVVRGKYRQLMLTEFDKDKYHQRSIVETVISVEKRVFGDNNTSRCDRLRNKESKLRNICYNVYRAVRIFVFEILRFSTEPFFYKIFKIFLIVSFLMTNFLEKSLA